MNREWKPGEVAMVIAHAFDAENRVAIRVGDTWADDHGAYWGDQDVLARPLVVIDPEDREHVERLRDAIYKSSWDAGNAHDDSAALQAALCEFANPTPLRIDEPGTYGVVEASCIHSHGRRHWVKGGNGNWYPVDNDETAPDDWDSLVEPVLVRAGVTDGGDA